MKKEKEELPQDNCNKEEKQNIHLSDTIKNAHAAGDGAMERSNDSLLRPEEDDDIDGIKRPRTGENY